MTNYSYLRLASSVASTLLVSALTFVSAVMGGERSLEWQGIGFYAPNGTEIRGGANVTHLGDSAFQIPCDPLALLDDENDLVPLRMRILSSSDDLIYSSVADHVFDPAMGIMTMSIQFTGGSGRFADATGTADLLIVFEDWSGGFLPANMVWSLVGTIDY